jgi:hypothetical protein
MSHLLHNDTSFLDSLAPDTPNDDPDTHITSVVPVVGPWNVLRNMAYRVKLQPGSLKKSKLLFNAVHALTATCPDQVKQAIKGIPDTDLVQCVFVRSGGLSLTVSESAALSKSKVKAKRSK